MKREDIKVGVVYQCTQYDEPRRIVTGIENGMVSFVWTYQEYPDSREYKVDINIFAQWVRSE